VAPGFLLTPHHTSEEVLKKRTAEIPLARGAKLDEIAPAVVYLASEASTYMTGEVILVNGGTTAR